jgi:4-amino-4-deoxy-L-arabinose transferase-like glycosyltransferase
MGSSADAEVTRTSAAFGVLFLALCVAVGPASSLGGLALLVVGWVLLWQGSSSRFPHPLSARWTGREGIGLVIVLGFSLFLRLWRLDQLPPPLWSDEAQHGLDALRIVTQGYRPLYFSGNCGQEPLYKYLVAASLSVIKHRVVAVRLPAAVGGTVLVAASYLLARRLWGRYSALFAGLLVSFSSWPLHFSRIAFRASLAPPIAAASILFLVSGRTRRHAALSGALAALGLYTYPAFRLFPVIPLAWLLAGPPCSSGGSRQRRHLLGTWLLAFLVLAAPLLGVACARPALFMARTEMASVFSETSEPLSALWRNTTRHLGMLTFEGDHNPRHNVPGLPMLSPLTAVLFLAGIVLMLRRQRRIALLLVGWLLLMLAPGVLSVERQAPHCLRSLGVLPVPYLFAAYALSLLGESRWARVVAVALLLVAGVWDTTRYWSRWPRALASVDPRGRSLYSFSEDEARLARWLMFRPDGRPVRLSPQLYLQPTVAFLAPPRDCAYRMLRHPDELSDGPAVLCLIERNLWWMRDDRRKQFFDWWYAQGLVSEAEVWEAMIRTYPQPCDLGSASDGAMCDALAASFSDFHVSSLGVFVLAETESVLTAPPPGKLRLRCADVCEGGWTCTGWVRFPPGAFAALAEGCSLRVDVREWCVEPAASRFVGQGHGRVDLQWPGEIRFAVEGTCPVRDVHLSFEGPASVLERYPGLALLRRSKAALHRFFSSSHDHTELDAPR